MADSRTLISAAALRDSSGTAFRPGRLLVQDGRIEALGGAELQVEGARQLNLTDRLLLPALVNGHAHLDLTALGPRPYPGSFLDWVGEVMRDRANETAAITASVHRGLELSRDAGVGWIGDIAASDTALKARALAPRELALGGVSWLECFGIGARSTPAAARADERLQDLRARCAAAADAHDLRLDLQPHAPYSAGLALYEHAARHGAPSTHLAETLEEAEFVRDASGPFADLLRRLQLFDEQILPQRASPVGALASALRAAPWVLAHVNYASDADLDLLASLPHPVTVAYCPVASDYFGHPRDGHPPHRYRDMLARGIAVCLGTDSILCQPADIGQPLSILEQMRHLHRRDGTDPEVLLRMATVHGAAALQLAPGTATLQIGAPARLAAVAIEPDDPRDALLQALAGDALLAPISC